MNNVGHFHGNSMHNMLTARAPYWLQWHKTK